MIILEYLGRCISFYGEESNIRLIVIGTHAVYGAKLNSIYTVLSPILLIYVIYCQHHQVVISQVHFDVLLSADMGIYNYISWETSSQ